MLYEPDKYAYRILKENIHGYQKNTVMINPLAAVTLLLTIFAWLGAGKIKKMDLTSYMTED